MTHGTRWLHLLLICFLLLAALATPPAARAAAPVVVTTTRDLTGSQCGADPLYPTLCSLRQAVLQVNALPDGESATIEFNIANTDPGYDGSDLLARTWTITLQASPLNFLLQGNTFIDGNSQARYRGGNPNSYGPEIFIDGRNVTTAGGILLYSNNNKVLGLGIVNFAGGNPTGTAIEVAGDNNVIQGNFLGLNKYGTAALPNTGPGLWLRGDNNLVGGNSSVSTTEFNIISGNKGDGILVDGLPSNAQNNQIRGNYIGTAKGGLNAVPNLLNGINVRIGASGTVIGTDPNSSDAVYRNVISGNGLYGIVIRDSQNNGMYGNWIGVDDTGDNRLANGTGGIQVLGEGGITTGNNRIGGPSGFARNIIAGNNGPGVNIRGSQATGVIVANNNIGLNFTNGLVISNTVPVRLQTYGVLLDEGAFANTIGGATAAERNVISGNNGDGVRIIGNPTLNYISHDNVVIGNYIGTRVDGSDGFPNAGSGVRVDTYADYNHIGGAAAGQGNLIAFNDLHGVHLAASDITSTEVRLNTIAENTIDGVHIDGAFSSEVRGNTIRYNGANGVRALGADYTTIAGENSATRSSITGNAADGINATGGVTLTVEFVTTAPEREGSSPNGGDGADLSGDSYTKILSSTLTNNRGIGVRLSGSSFSKILGLNYNTRTQISQNERGGVLLTNVFSSTLSYNEISRNGSDLTVADGLVITGTSQYIEARGNNASENRGVGVRATGARFLYYGVAQAEENGNLYNQVTGNRQGGFQLTGVTSATLRFNRINNNYNDGVRAENGTNDVVITRNFVQSNGPQNAPNGTCASLNSFAADARAAVGQGVSIRNGTGQTKRVQLLRNLFGQNCGLAILREPNGSALTDANEGIQPPTDLGLTKLSASTALVSGRILIAGAGRCDGCTVELYEADSLFKPDGEGRRKLNTAEDFIRSFDEKGNFSLTLNRIPAQLLATATDKNGNTSEFVVFTARYGIDIEPNRAGLGYPTQVITYYHTVTNSGNVGDTFQLSAKSTNGWKYSLLPPSTFQLLPGKSIPVTVTLTLPAGSVPQVRAGLVEQTFVRVTSIFSSTITDYVTDTTTVQPKVVISVSPLNSTAEVTATATALHTHQITNNGNITATLTLSASSLPFWATTISTSTLTLVPGQSQAVIVGVTAPAGTQAGTAAQTTINLTVPSDTTQNKVLTDITRVVVTPRVIIRPPVANGDGAADKVTTYTDFVVINNSNGSARFRLVATSTFGAVVGFRGIGGVTLDANNRFTLGIDPQGNPPNALQLAVDVRLPRVIPTGAVDVVTIQVLDDATGVILGTAQARTTVRSGRTIIYMPLVRKTV